MNKAHRNSQKLKQHAHGLFESSPSPLRIYYTMIFRIVFLWKFSVCKWVSLWYFSLFFLYILSNVNMIISFYIITSYFVIFYYNPLEDFSFSNERQKGNRFKWKGLEEQGGVEGEETTIRIYYVRKVSFIFNKMKKVGHHVKYGGGFLFCIWFKCLFWLIVLIIYHRLVFWMCILQ